MSKRVGVRLAVPGDAPALRSLVTELGYTAAGIDARLDDLLSRRDHRLWVAEVDDHRVGYALAHSHVRLGLGAPMVSLDELVVTASARGQGVGAALIAAVRTWASDLKAARLEVVTARTLESYRAGFYEKHGFREVDSAVLRHSS